MSAATAESITRPRRLLTRFGPFIVVLALAVATTSFLIFSGYTPLAPADNVVLGLFIANISTILLLFALVVVEGWAIVAAWRAGAAGARLHIRIVALFSVRSRRHR